MTFTPNSTKARQTGVVPAAFTIGAADFLLDGQPFRILAGALHYFRVHPDVWRDRIVKARQMGLNTIETYVAWNEHSPTPGEFDTSGGRDFARFLRIVQEEGMYAIVRPGPYICAEWDNGGLPGWLFRDEAVGIRRNEPRYMQHVTDYLERVYEIVEPLQISRGGPVILVQIENEYGAYGSDRAYLEALTALTRRCGITVPLTTIDQPSPEMLENGSLPDLHKTASFGSRPTERLATLRAHQPTGPLMCAEFWDGWFDHWGAHHHVTSVAQAAADLDELLASGASVNLYMFHGGTNFGLTNGANDKGVYQPTVTSYDYDSPLDEAGDPTEKYFAFRDVLGRYTSIAEDAPLRQVAPPAVAARFTTMVSLGELAGSDSADGADGARAALGGWQQHAGLPTLDDLGHYRGFALFSTDLGAGDPSSGDLEVDSDADSDVAGVLTFGEVRDRAAVFLDGRPVGVLLRDHHERSIVLPSRHGMLTVLVEDQGRVNYGPRLGEHKGLIGGAFLSGVAVLDWRVLPLDIDRAAEVVAARGAGARAVGTADDAVAAVAGPAFACAGFDIDEPVDLFLDTSTWGKGVAWINGFALGRYWRRGPQQTLYVPGPVLRAGNNYLVVFELESISDPVVHFVDGLRLGHTDF